MQTHLYKLNQIIKYLEIILAIIVIYIAYMIISGIQENSDFNKMYMCDGYAHNQEIAPDFCK